VAGRSVRFALAAARPPASRGWELCRVQVKDRLIAPNRGTSQQARFPSATVPVTPRRRCFAIGLGLPLVVFVLADAVFWLIDTRRDHCPGISG
jgi:hypothetical protein